MKRYNTNKADWGKFESVLQDRKTRLNSLEYNDKQDVVINARIIGKEIMEAAKRSIPRKNTRGLSVKWWNPELTEPQK